MPNYDDFDLDLQTSKVGGGDTTNSVRYVVTVLVCDPIIKSIAKTISDAIVNPKTDRSCPSEQACTGSNGCDFVANIHQKK